MAVVRDENAQLALLMEQYPEYPVVFETCDDVEAGYPQVIDYAETNRALCWEGMWYFSAEDFEEAYTESMYGDDLPEPDWYEDYFDRHAVDVIHVVLCDDEGGRLMAETRKPRYAVVIGWYERETDAKSRAELAERHGIRPVIVDTVKADVDFPDPVRDLAEMLAGKLDDVINAVTRVRTESAADDESGKRPLSTFLKEYRAQRRLSQDDLAMKLGVAKGTIQTWEYGGAISRPMVQVIRCVLSDVSAEEWDGLKIPYRMKRKSK